MKINPSNAMHKIKWWQALSILFFVSSAYFVFLFLSRASFSASDVVISILGPDSFKSQEKVEFELKIKNQSKFNLEGALYVTLPEFLVFEGSKENEQKIEFRGVKRGEELSEKILVFAKDTQKQGLIKVRAEYTPEGLHGRFDDFADLHIAVSLLPLTVIFDLPEKAVDGQLLRGSFHFVAEKELEVLPLLARMMLPEEFILKDAEPKPSKTTTWEFDKIEYGRSYRVDFEGIMRGRESENKKFSLLFGIGDGESEADFLEQYKVSREVRISSAPIEFKQLINGRGDYISSPGEELQFQISYANKSGVDIEDVTISAELSGEAFDFDTLNAGSGYFKKNTKTIIWNKDFLEKLSVVEKDASDHIEFYIRTKNDLSPRGYKDKNFLLKSKAVIDATRVPLALKGLSLRSEDTSEVTLRTHLELLAEAYYYEGPFSNTGPIPPKVGEKTTYTILLKAKNTLNEAKDVAAEASLPESVTFEDRVYPAGSNLIYNSQTHGILWSIGKLAPGVGGVIPAKTIAFQISIIPSEIMRGSVAELFEQSQITGTDTFTNEIVESVASPLDTALPLDEGIREGDGVVR